MCFYASKKDSNSNKNLEKIVAIIFRIIISRIYISKIFLLVANACFAFEKLKHILLNICEHSSAIACSHMGYNGTVIPTKKL